MKKLMGAVFAAAVAGAANVGLGATYTNEVAQGVTQTFAQMETALGIKLAADDTIVKKGPGILQTDSGHAIKCTVTVEEGVFNVNCKMAAGGTVTVKKGACLYVTSTTQQMLDGWTYYLEGEGTGETPYLGSVVINCNNGNGQLLRGTFNLSGDTTFYTCENIINYMFSGNSASDGPTLNMNKHTLTLKGQSLTSKFRARHKLTIRSTGTIIVDGMVYSRHNTTDDYSPDIPQIKLVNGAIASLNAAYISQVDEFACDDGTSFGYTNGTNPGLGNEKSIVATLKKVVGCPSVLSDTVLTLGNLLVVRGADLAAGHYLTSKNTLTFADGCMIDAVDLGEAGLSSGKTFTIAASEEGIVGTPTLTETAAYYFTLAKTDKAVTLTVKDGFADGGLLPGEEHAAANTAALANLNLTDGAILVLSKGDYYFSGDFDLTALTARNVTISSLGSVVNVHATLKLGAAQNVTVDRLCFKGCEGPAIVADGTEGLTVDGCTLDSVVGAWPDGKKYPFVFTNVQNLEVKAPAYRPLEWKTWDAPALLDGGTQLDGSQVRAGELVVNCPPNLVYKNSGGTQGWLYWSYVADYFGLNDSAFNGLKLVKLGSGTLDMDSDIAARGVDGVEILEGQFVVRSSDTHLGKAKSKVIVHDGGCLCLAGGGKNVENRTVEIEGAGVVGHPEEAAVRFTSSSAWNKASTVTWKLTGDATMYDNVANAANGTFLWSTFDTDGHTLTLLGKTGGCYRFGRWCNWKGGGKMVVKGVAVSASISEDGAKAPSTTAYKVKEGSQPQFVFRDKATFGPDTCELAVLMNDLDFATPDCTFTAKESPNFPHDFVFSRLAGAPIVSDVINSITVTNNYTVHVADLKKGKTLTTTCPLVFADGATLTLDDLSGFRPQEPTLVATAAGGITGKPRADAALRAARLGVVKEGNSLYVRPVPGFCIFVH